MSSIKPRPAWRAMEDAPQSACAGAPLPQRCRPRRYVIVGGGIAGVTAAEELLELANADELEGEGEGAAPVEVTLLTATQTVKQVGRVVKVTQKLEEVDVVERDANDFAQGRNLRILHARATAVDAQAHVVHCQGGGGWQGVLVCASIHSFLHLFNLAFNQTGAACPSIAA